MLIVAINRFYRSSMEYFIVKNNDTKSTIPYLHNPAYSCVTSAAAPLFPCLTSRVIVPD